MNKFITHSGTLHTDETMAFTIINGLYNDIELIRTRDETIIKKGLLDNNIIVADIGKELNLEQNNFDHHFASKSLEEYEIDEYYTYTAQGIRRAISEVIIEHGLLIKMYNILNDKNFSIKTINKLIDKILLNNNKGIFLSENFSIEEYIINEFEKDIIFILSELEKKLNISNLLTDNKNNILLYSKYKFLENIKYRKYSSAGLIWYKYGYKYINKIISKYFNIKLSEKDITTIFNNIDKSIISIIDGLDNGYINFEENNISINQIISVFNGNNINGEEQNDNFKEASLLLSKILNKFLIKEFNKINNEKKIIKILTNAENNIYGNVIEIEEYIGGIDKEINIKYEGDIKAVIYPSNDVNTPGWYIKTIQQSKRFGDHIGLPMEWINDIGNIKGLKFCHTGRFIALFDNKENLYNALLKNNYLNY